MRKIIFATVLLSLALPISAFAGEWKQDGNGWWYQRDDGTYPKNQWEEIEYDGQKNWYCFNADGYMYSNAITPDGYIVASSGEWTALGKGYMSLEAQYPNDYIMIAEGANWMSEFSEKALVDCGAYYRIDDMYAVKNKEYHLNEAELSIGNTITLNGDKYKITSRNLYGYLCLECTEDNSGEGVWWVYLQNNANGSYYLIADANDYVYEEILYHGPIYLRKDCAINEVSRSISGDRYKNTVEGHFAGRNQYRNDIIPEYLSTEYIYGTYKTDKNGLLTQIDQYYLP